MGEVLTIEQIESRYAPDWVLIGEPDTDDLQRLKGGKVIFHSPDRDAVYREAMQLPPGHYAFRFLGKLPEDMVLVL